MRMRSRTLVDKYDSCGKQHCVSIPESHMSAQMNVSSRFGLESTLEHEIAMFGRSS